MAAEHVGYPAGLTKEAMVLECGENIQLTIAIAESLDLRTNQENYYYIQFLDVASGVKKLQQILPDTHWSIARPLSYYLELEKRGLIRDMNFLKVPRAKRNAYLSQFGVAD